MQSHTSSSNGLLHSQCCCIFPFLFCWSQCFPTWFLCIKVFGTVSFPVGFCLVRAQCLFDLLSPSDHRDTGWRGVTRTQTEEEKTVREDSSVSSLILSLTISWQPAISCAFSPSFWVNSRLASKVLFSFVQCAFGDVDDLVDIQSLTCGNFAQIVSFYSKKLCFVWYVFLLLLLSISVPTSLGWFQDEYAALLTDTPNCSYFKDCTVMTACNDAYSDQILSFSATQREEVDLWFSVYIKASSFVKDFPCADFQSFGFCLCLTLVCIHLQLIFSK